MLKQVCHVRKVVSRVAVSNKFLMGNDSKLVFLVGFGKYKGPIDVLESEHGQPYSGLAPSLSSNLLGLHQQLYGVSQKVI
jgi:hypothetical protein